MCVCDVGEDKVVLSQDFITKVLVGRNAGGKYSFMKWQSLQTQ